ncbi:MAG: homoaconitase [Candidatus Krumholzibacteriia bacterium]
MAQSPQTPPSPYTARSTQQTVIEKITQAHAVDLPDGHVVKAGDYVTVVPDHVMTHDNTAAVMLKYRGLGAGRFANPRQPVFTLDHNIQDTSEQNLAKYREIEEFAEHQGVDHYPAGRGIGHQVMVEEGYVQPGGFVVASDSHSNMYGALGAVGTPVVRTDAAVLWATGRVWWQVPRTVRVNLLGELPAGSTGKDVIITLCGIYNQGEVLNAAVEFAGDGVGSLSMESRLAIANMTTEWGALVGWFPVDEITIAWLRERAAYLRREGRQSGLTDEKIDFWAAKPPSSDCDAVYAGEIDLNLGDVTPHVSGPDTVQTMTSLAQLARDRVAIQKAYLVSCVNSRAEDLEAAAEVLRGRRVADGVQLYLAAASKLVEEEARGKNVWQTLLDAGAQTLPPGCGPCIGLGTGLLEPGEVGISATNRNFKGRMGSRDARCYLASPAVVAASAVAGYITGPEGTELPDRRPQRHFRAASRRGEPVAAAGTDIIDGFPSQLAGRLLWLPTDNLNTDGIYGKDYTYREDMTPEMMARVVMENYDPTFADRMQASDIIVGGYNFGTGSSREQAATALMAAGIGAVVAGSFSQTYLRNAFNNGFICVNCPELVDALREEFATQAADGEKTVISGDMVELDFEMSLARWRDRSFPFGTLGRPVQELVVAGGVENLARQRLGGH